jgi:hypothetical protein
MQRKNSLPAYNWEFIANKFCLVEFIYAGKFLEQKTEKTAYNFERENNFFFADSRQKVANSPIAATKVGLKITDVHNNMKKTVFRIMIGFGVNQICGSGFRIRLRIRIRIRIQEAKMTKIEKN